MEHISRLAARGHDAAIFFLQGDPKWFTARPLPCQRFPNTTELGKALKALPNGASKVATFVTTWEWTANCLNPGDKGFGLLQDFDGKTYLRTDEADKQAFSYGLTPIVESEWVERTARDQYGLSPVNVGIGIDHDVFFPRPIDPARQPKFRRPESRDRMRIFAPHRSKAGPNDLKGWETAFWVIKAACEFCCGGNAPGIVTFGIEGPPELPRHLKGQHIHVVAPTDQHLAELYSDAGVVLVTSRHEGFGLIQAEAMACGAPVVCTPADGNAEFSIDGETCLVGADLPALTRHVQRLLKHPDFAADLGERGRQAVQRYRWDEVIDKLERTYAQ